VKRLCIPQIRHILRYLRRLAALKIVSSLTSSRDLFLSHAATSLHSVQLGTMILLGTPWGQSALMASNARSRSGALLRRRGASTGDEIRDHLADDRGQHIGRVLPTDEVEALECFVDEVERVSAISKDAIGLGRE
jgi:hypothetical protein